MSGYARWESALCVFTVYLFLYSNPVRFRMRMRRNDGPREAAQLRSV